MNVEPTDQAVFKLGYAQVNKRIRLLNSHWKMRLFYFKRLPTVWWWGIRVISCTPHTTQIAIPYSWRTQNPFRSIYFAALLGAAELSTGLMAMLAITGRGPISMLITHIASEFVKKADGTVIFTCGEGQALIDAVQQAIDTGEGQAVTVNSVGRLADGTEVARIQLTWSFKVKKGK